MSASQRSGRSSPSGTGEPGCAAIPIGLALTTPELVGQRVGESGPGTGASSTSIGSPPSDAGARPPAAWSGSTTSNRRTPSCDERVRDGGAGAARAEEHDAVAVDVGEPVARRPGGSR